MDARGNRTFICSVVFIDIVEYTKKAVIEQIQHKERLNALLSDALKDVAPNDRIILDTGDGAAISFVGDPEDALFVCLTLRDATQALPSGPGALPMRIGINLGPVKLIKDLNGQANIVGDGINVAQRVMSFAEPNQVLVSRSYFEVVSCLSESYAKLFHYEGSRTDKHVREHEVYAVADSTGEIQRSHRAALAMSASGWRKSMGVARIVADRLSTTMTRVKENLHARPKVSTALAVAAILLLAVGMRGLRDKPATQVAKQDPVVTESAAPKVEPVAAAPAAKAKEAATAPGEEVAATPEEKTAAPKEKVARAPREKVAVAPARKDKAATPSAKRAPDPEPASAPAEPGFLAFAISPWGEIIVDGKSLGVSPPLQELPIGPGRHRVEVRNTSFTPLVQVVEVKSGERIRIRHRFK